MIILDYYWNITCRYMYVMILYVFEIACSCGKNFSSPLSLRELCDSAIREMNNDKFLSDNESDSDVSM